MYPHSAPWLVLVGIPAITLVMMTFFVLGNRQAALAAGLPPERARSKALLAALGALSWMAMFGAAAASGSLARFDIRPPPMALMFVAVLAGGIGFGLSSAGRALATNVPLAWLIGVHAFRLPLELVMHEASRAGVMPNELSFSGFNLDIVTGTTALPLALLVARGKAPKLLVWIWSVWGFAMLAVIAAIAIATAPFVKAFGEGSVNSWVCYVPFVWLPGVLVPFALAGHIVVVRSLTASLRMRPAR